MMLRQKEVLEKVERQKEEEKRMKAYEQKANLHNQMAEREQLRLRAQEEYLKEKSQVDAVVNKMISEDMQLMSLTKEKQDQAKNDMKHSLFEKKRQEREMKRLEQYENEMVQAYAHAQEARAGEIMAKKAAEEAEREQIFLKLKQEQEKREADAEYIETLRFQLYQEETEEQARQREREDQAKRERIRRELLEAK